MLGNRPRTPWTQGLWRGGPGGRRCGRCRCSTSPADPAGCAANGPPAVLAARPDPAGPFSSPRRPRGGIDVGRAEELHRWPTPGPPPLRPAPQVRPGIREHRHRRHSRDRTGQQPAHLVVVAAAEPDQQLSGTQGAVVEPGGRVPGGLAERLDRRHPVGEPPRRCRTAHREPAQRDRHRGIAAGEPQLLHQQRPTEPVGAERRPRGPSTPPGSVRPATARSRQVAPTPP